MQHVLLYFFLTLHSLMRGLYFLSLHFFQVLGEKPELRDGDDDDDTVADLTNRKMARLYMVSSLRESPAISRDWTWWGGRAGRGSLLQLISSSLPSERNV